MQDKDSLSSSFPDNLGSSAKAVEYSLITLERAQKLDLLIHLVSNLRQSLVICGPPGIGKTTLLDQLKARKKDDWAICSIQSLSQLSFESFQEQLSHFLQQWCAEFKDQPLTSILSGLDKQKQKIVVILDDAGKLVPGLISTLIQYASASVSLRLVFALTHDELHIKNSSDRAIDDCHFIDIPPLTENQCQLFLQNLSAQPGAVISFKAINERLIEKLYRETHGIPGKIIAELPKLSNYQAVAGFQWGGIAVVAALIAIASVTYFSIEKPGHESAMDQKPEAPLLLKQAQHVEISSPVIDTLDAGSDDYETKKIVINPQKTETSQKTAIAETEVVDSTFDAKIAKEEVVADSLQQKESQQKEHVQLVEQEKPVKPDVQKDTLVATAEKIIPTENVVTVMQDQHNQALNTAAGKQTDKKPEAIEQKKKLVKLDPAKNDDSAWVLKQPAKNYTLQIIVLSTRQAAVDFLKNNKSLTGSLRFYASGKQKNKKYVLIYGSFKSMEAALKKMKSLPAKYRKSWVRRFASLQKDIKSKSV